MLQFRSLSKQKCTDTITRVCLFLSQFCYIPVEDVLFIRCAPSFGAAGFAPRPLPADKGLAFVVGGGAAIAAQGSSSDVPADFTFSGFEAVLGAGAAMEPHKSSSSFLFALLFIEVFGAGAAMDPHKSSSSLLDAFTVFLGRRLPARGQKEKATISVR